MADMPAWEDVADKMTAAFPDLDPTAMQKKWEETNKLSGIQRAADLEQKQEGVGGFMLRKMTPVLSMGLGVQDAFETGMASKRVKEGTHTDEDYWTLARHGAQQSAQQERTSTVGRTLAEAAAGLPAMVGDFAIGGAITKGIAGLAPKAVAPWIAAQEGATASIPKMVGQFATQSAATTAAVPSMYAEKWIANNTEQGRDPLNPKGFPDAFALGMIQTALITGAGTLAGKIGPGGTGLLPATGRVGIGAGLGTAGATVADYAHGTADDLVRAVAPEWVAKESHYGPIGDALAGKWGEAGKSLAVTALTFTAFSVMHDRPNPQKVMDQYIKSLNEGFSRGETAESTSKKLAPGTELIRQALDKNPNLTKSEALEAIKDLPEGPARTFAEAQADMLHEKVPEAVKPPKAPEVAKEEIVPPAKPQGQQEPLGRPGQPTSDLDAQRAALGMGPAVKEVPVVHPVDTAIRDIFPGGETDTKGIYRAKVGDSEVFLTHNPDKNSVLIDFDGKAKPLKEGLKTLIETLKDSGTAIEYRTKDTKENRKTGGNMGMKHHVARAQVYDSVLKESGYEQVGGPGTGVAGPYSWKPKEVPEPSKGLAPPAPGARGDAEVAQIAERLRDVVEHVSGGKTRDFCLAAANTLKEIYPETKVYQGKYNGKLHFLAQLGDHYIDVTADQFGGPKVQTFRDFPPEYTKFKETNDKGIGLHETMSERYRLREQGLTHEQVNEKMESAPSEPSKGLKPEIPAEPPTPDRLHELARMDIKTLDAVYNSPEGKASGIGHNEYMRTVERLNKEYLSHGSKKKFAGDLDQQRERIANELVPGLRKMAADGVQLKDYTGKPINLGEVADFYETQCLGAIDSIRASLGITAPAAPKSTEGYAKSLSTDTDLQKAQTDLQDLVVPFRILEAKEGNYKVEQQHVEPLKNKADVDQAKLEKLVRDVWERGYAFTDGAPENLTLDNGKLKILDLDSLEPRGTSGFESAEELNRLNRNFYGWKSTGLVPPVAPPEAPKTKGRKNPPKEGDELTEREQKILELRQDKQRSLESIGEELGITRERVRQLEKDALTKQGRQQSVAKEHEGEKESRILNRIEENPEGFVDNESGEFIGTGGTVDRNAMEGETLPNGKRVRAYGKLRKELYNDLEKNQDLLEAAWTKEITDAGGEHKLPAERAARYRELTDKIEGDKKLTKKEIGELTKVLGQPASGGAEAPGPEAAGATPRPETAQGLAPPVSAAEKSKGSIAGGPEGMGAAGGGRVESPPPPGAPGAAAPGAPAPAPGLPTLNWFQRAKDFLKSFGQQQFPTTTRLSRESGEKLAEVANAKVAAGIAWNYFKEILKVNGKPLGEMSPEESRFIGAVWLERRMRHFRDYLKSQGLNSDKVGTLVGQEGSPLETEADYEQGRQVLKPFWEAVKQEWTREVERHYKGLLGLEPEDNINSPSQLDGLPLNAIALTEGSPDQGVIRTNGQGMGNLKLRKPGFTRTAELSADAYDVDIHHMMERTLNLGMPAAKRAEFARIAIEAGVMEKITGGEKPTEGFKYLGLDPAGGLPGLEKSASYYVHPDAYREVVQGLGIGERPGSIASGVKAFMDKVYAVAVMAPVDLATHVANNLTSQFRSGMGVPVVNTIMKAFPNAYKVYMNDPVILEKIKDLSEMGASFHHESRPGLLGEKLQKYDPTAYINKFTSKFIDVMQKAVRLQLSDAYDKLVDAGLVPESQTGKRDFINQAVGNYSSTASNPVTQFIKDTGLQSFATAAHTFTMQGAKVALGGAINAEATSYKAAAQLRATAMLKMLPVVALGPVLNSLIWGEAFPANMPAFTVKTGDDDKKVSYIDPLKFIGLRRGWRATGQNALIEGAVQGLPSGKIIDKAVKDFAMTGEHALAGPPVQFAHTLMTGENAMGHQVAEKVSTATTSKGMAAAQRRGAPEPGSSQFIENAKAAIAGINPLIASFTQADRPKTPRTFVENLMQSAGPFGETTRDKPKKKSLGVK